MIDKDWFMDDGVIKLHKDRLEPEENTPLFHVTYLLKNNIFTIDSVKQVLRFIEVGKIRGSRSHDNMTAIMVYLVKALVEVKMDKTLRDFVKLTINKLKILPDYTHPRDFIFIMYIQNRITFWLWFLATIGLVFISPLFLLLNPLTLLMIMFIYMGIKKYKVRGNQKFFKTDTEILYWIRLQLPKRYFLIHITKPFIVPLLKRKFGDNWFMSMMKIFYRDPNHPNRN